MKKSYLFGSAYTDEIILDEEYINMDFLWYNKKMVLGRCKLTGKAYFFYKIGDYIECLMHTICEVSECSRIYNYQKKFRNMLNRLGYVLQTVESATDYYEVIKPKPTLVDFRMESGVGCLAVFPRENYNKRLYGTDRKNCYSHYGQHSGVQVSYYKALPKASPEQYAELKAELESYGPTWKEEYNLIVL